MKNPKIDSKFNNDLIWNILAFGGIVIVGVLLNILIIKFYDEEALGVFNLTYATYILLSQLAVGGVHLSIQYFVPKYSSSKEHVSNFLVTALFSSIITGVVVISFSYLLIPSIGQILNSPRVSEALYFTLWGLFFFSFNKIILSVHNGLRNMKHFALFQFLRFVFMVSILVIFIFKQVEMQYLASLLALTELLLSILLLFSIFKYLNVSFNKRFRKVFLLQFNYGKSALTSNFLLDINTKVDVFTLGIFLNDYWVGIYSFAATIAEGFFQLPVLFRNNINPIITRIYTKRNYVLLEKILKKSRNGTFKLIFVLGLLSIICFPLIPHLLNINNIITVSIIYTILCSGFIISGGHQPFLMIFNQLGNPKIQTIYIFLIFITNVIFNFLFVPLIGIYGAAVGTMISFIIQVISLKYLLHQKFNINI